VGDQDGVLQVFSVKKGDVQIGFKTLPGAGISCLELGGALGRYVIIIIIITIIIIMFFPVVPTLASVG